MKQHITIEQLEELTEDKLDKLTLWMMHNDYYNNDGICLNIGQMIEFLDEHEQYHWQMESVFWEIKRRRGWILTFNGKQTNYNNLCDALWEAVKECL